MPRHRHLFILTLGLFMAACGPATASLPTPDELTALPTLPPTEPPTETPPPTATANPCEPGRAAEISMRPLLDMQRAFDDQAEIAANVPRSELEDNISALQAIRRDTEDVQIPECLLELKLEQVKYMNAVIDTLLAFLRGASAEEINLMLEGSRGQRLVLENEVARLRGVTLTPSPTADITPTPAP